jgi:hypothetical protein
MLLREDAVVVESHREAVCRKGKESGEGAKSEEYWKSKVCGN